MLTNTDRRSFDVIEVTNEMPIHRTGGVGTVIEGLMSGLAAEGLDVLWFLTDHGYGRREIAAILARFPQVAVGEGDELRHFDAPICHLHAYQENPSLEAHVAGRRTVCTVHSLLALEETSNDVDLTSAVCWQEALITRCDRVVVVSQAERRRYAELGYGALNRRLRVIHNGVRPPRAFRAPRRKRALGYCGRLVPRKHPEYVQLILEEADFADRRALVAGRGFSQYARRVLRDHSLDGRVDFLGWCAGPRREAFFDAIDVLAVPSIYEPFGLVALEAAACGVPVVCTRVDGLVEVLGEHAFYCDDSSYEAFRRAMRRWDRESPEGLELLARRARARYRSRFTDRIMGASYRRLFAEMTA
jgi:glycosyltransferase involved in cell wall biosynthesis